VLQDHLSSGCEMVSPEEIGALTAAPILSEEVVRSEEGKVADVGRRLLVC
jgi:hypothetical protein